MEGLLSAHETRRAGVESLFGGLAQLDPTAVAPHAPKLAGALGLYPHEFWRELEAFRRKGQIRRSPGDDGETGPGTVRERLKLDPLDSALCAILWRDAGRRRTPPEEVLGLLEDERVKEVALAILMDSPGTLEDRWLSLGDQWPLALISRGDAFCDELGDADPWEVVCSGLRRRRTQARLGELNARMKRGEATPEDLSELQALAADLKRRN